MDYIFLARQPILDRQQNLVAYELLFRSYRAEHAIISDNMNATSVVIHNAFCGMGISAVLGKLCGYINVDAQFLLSDLVEALPPRQVIMEILESVEPDDKLIDRVRELRRRGYLLALDDYVGDLDKTAPLLSEVDIVKVDVHQVGQDKLGDAVSRLRRNPVRLIAEKVETQEQFQQACDLGFDFFQGYYFARPQLLARKQQKNPGKVYLLRLLSMVMSDADINILEAEFKGHPILSYNLIRIVNSAAMGLRERIKSLRHAIVLLGRRQLQVWMQLLLYTVGDDNVTSNPLLLTAAARGKLMELVARSDPNATREDHDTAFMVGILSLVDALLEMPRREILDELPVSDVVRDALLFGKGKQGSFLRLIVKVENGELEDLKVVLAEVPWLDFNDLLQMQLESVAWANNIGKDGD